MKYVLVFQAVLAFSNLSAQNLEYGVPTELELISGSYEYSYCFDFEPPVINHWISLSSNIYPYASGMSLTLYIDSLSGDLDSLNVPVNGSYDFVQVPAAIPIESSIHLFIDTIANYGSTTLYYRLVANGTPSVLDEAYHCSHSSVIEFDTCDPCCTDYYLYIYAGENEFDNTPDCMVSAPTDLEEQHLLQIEVYSNPSTDRLLIDLSDHLGPFTIQLIGMDGRQALGEQLRGGAMRTLDISNLHSGLYCVMVQNPTLKAKSRLIVKQ